MRTSISPAVIRKGLHVITAAGLLGSAAFWFWNPEPSARSRTLNPRAPAANAQSAIAQSGADNAVIVAENIFSASRTRPGQRYNPADEGFDSPEEQPVSTMAEVSPAPQLFGTLLSPAGAMALMQGDSSTGASRLYREGEKIGSYRLLKVKANSVIMSGPSGRLEIQVQRGSTGAQ